MALSRLASMCSVSNLLNPISPFFPYAPSILRCSISTSNGSITIETFIPFMAHNCDTPSHSVDTSAAELLSFFGDMAVMRHMEVAADSLYKPKLMRGFCHIYDSQEAIAVGMESSITKKDCIITAFRDHCTFLNHGGTLVEVFAENDGLY